MDRKTYIGGGDIAAVMGLSKWTTPLQLWAEKTGKVEPRDLSNVEAVEIGSELEDYVARKFQRKSGYKVRRDSRDFIHVLHPYMAGHIDRWVVGSDALLECKTTSAWREKEWRGEDIPQEYILQVNWYMGIVGKSIGYIAVLIGGQKFLWKELAFNKSLFDKQVEAAKHFWEFNILQNIPPLAIAGDEEILQKMFENATEPILRLEDPSDVRTELDNLVDERKGGLEQKKLIEEELSRIESRMKQILGEHESATTGSNIITWKEQRVAPFINTDAMRQDGAYEKYEMLNRKRVLRTKKIGEKNE